MPNMPLVARERADLYATRAVVVEVIRYLSMNDPSLISHLRQVEAKQPMPAPPLTADVPIGDAQIRTCFAELLASLQ